MRTTQMFDDDGHLEGVVATIKDVTEEAAPQKREVIAESPLMREVLNFVRRVAASEATTILLEGENGTGKDLIAKTLHYQSIRQAEPFIAINCAAIPETLLESELFGYEKGAFTDARQQKRGIFELADKGTLFLDEVGEIPLMLQAKLLRVLEDQSFRRLGGLKDIQLDLRVIAATNKNLREAVKEGAFRQDLYFRLNVIQIVLPPLRDRAGGHSAVGALLHRALQPQVQAQYRRRIGRRGGSAAGARLAGQRARTAQRHRARHDSGRIDAILRRPACRSPSRGRMVRRRPARHGTEIPAEGLSLEDNERMLLARALEKTGGNQTQAARLLRITRDTLRYKMKKFNLR